MVRSDLREAGPDALDAAAYALDSNTIDGHKARVLVIDVAAPLVQNAADGDSCAGLRLDALRVCTSLPDQRADRSLVLRDRELRVRGECD